MNITSSITPKSFTITASGWYLNNQWHSIPIRPDEDSELIPEFKLKVNSMYYDLDSYITSAGTTVGTGTNGFSLDFNNSPTYIRVKWNNIVQNYGGFNLSDRDVIILRYMEG